MTSPTVKRVLPVFGLLASIWVLSIIGFVWRSLLSYFALVPREFSHLPGILGMPFVHKDLSHLLANSLPLAVFSGLVLVQGSLYFVRALLGIVLLGGAALWLIGRPGAHIGASGLVFGLFGLLLARAYYNRSLRSLLIAAAVMLGYGGLVWGILPTQSAVSWEAHLTGAGAGVIVAKYLAKSSTASATNRDARQ